MRCFLRGRAGSSRATAGLEGRRRVLDMGSSSGRACHRVAARPDLQPIIWTWPSCGDDGVHHQGQAPVFRHRTTGGARAMALGQGAQRRSGLLHLAGAAQHATSTADSRRASWSAAQLRHLKSVRSYRRHTGADQLSVRDGRDNWREVKR